MNNPNYQSNFIAKVPNDIAGNLIISELRKYLNKESYSLRIRGSKPKVKGSRGNCQSIPLCDAQELRIYIMCKIGKDTQSIGIQDAIQKNRTTKENWKLISKVADLMNDYEKSEVTIYELKNTIDLMQKNRDVHASNLTTALQEKQEEIEKLKARNSFHFNSMERKIKEQEAQIVIFSAQRPSGYSAEKITDILHENAELKEFNNNQAETIRRLQDEISQGRVNRSIDEIKTIVRDYDEDAHEITQDDLNRLAKKITL